MAHAGHDSKLEVCATKAGAYKVVDGCKSMDTNLSRDDFDTTNFKSATTAGDYQESHTRMALLKAVSASASGDFIPADDGQAILLAAMAAGTTVWCKFYYAAATYCLVECYVQLGLSCSVDGVWEFNATLNGTSTWAWV